MTAPISSAMIPPEANAAEQSRLEMQARIRGLGGIGNSRMSEEARAKKLREACEGFESIFIQKMWQEMRNTIPRGGMMHGKEERFWQDMYDQELSKSMTSAGGIGLADMMYEQLSRNLVSASRSAAAMSNGGAFMPAAAPLVTEIKHEEISSPLAADAGPAQTVASIYDGEAPQAGEAETAVRPQAEKSTEPARPVQPTQQLAAAPAQPVAPPQQPAAAPQREREENVVHVKPRKRISRHYPSGPELAHLAKREAGDKLGPRAVRPPLHPRREDDEENQAPSQPATAAAPPPGSPEALRAAMDLAKSGAVAPQTSNPAQLNEIVAQARARNAALAQGAQATSPAQAVQSAEAEPVKTVTRFTTNIPRKSRNVKNGKQASNAIRMLNVDNVGVNSKAGQGIAAYHASQEAANARKPENIAAPAAPLTPASPAQAAPQAVIPPLAAPQPKTDEAAASFSIPPLTASNT